ncbi:syntaxin-binding protein 5 isoform X1 [Diorhabda sublineata]|uniref:syntaxin-binding protein 5 isoform X1 n=1 Tax=Diorhabda sublineata TaxID=1163346 RepID=UPI0024E17736|nr:syntaxin-binding protein 5 isoform X1 [Diorhabda sublineata]
MRREKDDRREVMKKFTFKGVLDNFRNSVAQPSRQDQEIQETLKSDHFQIKRTFRHGFPFQPTAMAYDPVQKLLAIGSKCGSLRILGQPGVDVHVRHDMDGPPGSAAVLHLQFLVNEGALISATADDTLHLWNFRQRIPQIVQSLKFQKDRITYMHLPLQSKWLYVGSERGNVHVIQIENFNLSGYVINWNKTIEASRKTHPGAIVHLSDNPLDASKLLIGFDSGQVVLWDLKNKMVDMRWLTSELRSISWHYEGKQFMCSHTDGTLTTWSLKSPTKYIHISQPHAKFTKDGKPEQCRPISKVEWKTSRTGEYYVIFSGGMPYDQASRTPCITVVYSKTTTVLEMEHNVIDFIILCESPYASELQEPYGIIALLQNDLVIMDLQTPGFPCLENPYPMDIHESPVTCCSYLADCPADLIPAFYSVGRAGAMKRSGFSEMDWPVSGGTWPAHACTYAEIIMTGHSDGSIKFWDASAGTLQVLYKLKTAKVFEKPKARSLESEDEPFAIEIISLCPESRKLCVAGASSHVILFTYKKTDSFDEVTVLEIPITYEVPDEGEISPDCQFSGPGSAGSGNKLDMLDIDSKRDGSLLKVKTGNQKKLPGFQAQLVCLTPWNNGEPPSHISALTVNSSYGLMAYGNEAGIVIIDIEQKVCLLNVGSPDMYGAQDPYSRVPRSPKKGQLAAETGNVYSDKEDRQPRSPSIDQMGRSPESPFSFAPCPTPVEQACEAIEEEKAVPIPQNRRKSSTWKGFNLKRQLSKVDIKIKNPLKEKRGSIFYNDVTSYQDNFDNLEETETSPESDENTIIDNQSVIDLTVKQENQETNITNIKRSEEDILNLSPEEEPAVPFLVGSLGSYNEHNRNKPSISRPDNLELTGDDGSPVRPPRHKKKQQIDKRDQRLLSVPNIKFQKADAQNYKDLRDKEEVNATSPQPTFTGNLMRRFRDTSISKVLCNCVSDKLDSSFSRSRSSSMSSLENITSESIQCLAFVDSYTKKSEPSTLTPTLWVGTSLGSVITIYITPPDVDSRSSQPVVVSLVGATIFRLKGSILTMSFLDCNGSLIPYSFESWKDEQKEKRDRTPTRNNSRMSPTLIGSDAIRNDNLSDRQFVVMASEKQARVVALPSQTCVYRQQLADTDFVVKAEVISMRVNVCLACYISNGHLTTYSLPSLRPLLDIDFLPLSELSFQTQSNKGIIDPMLSIWGQQLIVNEDTDQITRTFNFSNRGHGLYLASPSELQKFTLCAEFCSNLTEMIGELFLPTEMPEPPKEGFFKGLFGGGVRSLDREELFGESSGKPSKAVAKHIPGNMPELSQRATTAISDVSRAHKLMMERGDKLNQLEDRAEKMRNEAENFSSSAHELMLKYKDKKWYQL